MPCHSERSEESIKAPRFSKVFPFIVFIFFILQACSYTDLEKEAPDVNEIGIEKKFNIILPENHDQNFLWKFKEDHNKSVIDYWGAVWHGNDKGIYFRFKSVSTGIDTLRFTQYKTDPVTKERDSVKTAVYIVKVLE